MAATVWRREPRDHAEPPPLPVVLEARRERLLATFFTIVGFAVFLLAAIIDPFDDAGRPRTHGTHRQLGLPACTLRSLTGVGCPSCGMTTAFSLFVHADPAAAWNANWAGCVIAVLGLVTTGWFLAVAAGLPPGRLTPHEVVKQTCATGPGQAVVRWLATHA